MKKLALALVCLISVAFFASCNDPIENPEPTISMVSDEGYTSTDAEIVSGTTVMFGFNASANTQTNEALTSFNLKVTSGDQVLADSTYAIANQATYSFDASYSLEGEGVVTITGTVTDAANETASVTINLTLVEAQLPVDVLAWVRAGGNDGVGLEPFGLKWTRNFKEVFATIETLEGTKFYQFDSSVWANTNTESEKLALFESTSANEITMFREISCNQSNDYDFVLGTSVDGKYYLIHLTHADVTTATAGTTVTISGEWK
jgi:hypothetical protein